MYYILNLLPSFTFFLITLFIIRILFFKKNFFFHSHWNFFNMDFSFSSIEFYKLLQKELYKNKTSNVYFKEVRLKEGNFFSSRRLYLRIYWKDFHFDVCAAPFGNSFFISWWLLYRFSFVEMIVLFLLGRWIYRKLFPNTYHKIDTATAFMKHTHTCVLNILDELTIGVGARFLDDEERKPILNDVFNR